MRWVAVLVCFIVFGVFVSGASFILNPSASVTLQNSENQNIKYIQETGLYQETDDFCVAQALEWELTNPMPDNKTENKAIIDAWTSDKPKLESCTSLKQITTTKNITTRTPRNIITIDNKTIDSNKLNVWCYDNSTAIICKSNTDGDGWTQKKELKPGTSYFIVYVNNGKITNYVSAGHLAAQFDQEVG